MLSDVCVRRALLVAASAWAALPLSGGALGATPASEAPVLHIGRIDRPSLLADIAEGVMRHAFARVGRRVVFDTYPPLRSLLLASEGAIDGDLGRIADAATQFPALIRLATPIARIDVAVFLPPGAASPFSRQRLPGMRIGTTRGQLVVQKLVRELHVSESSSLLQTLQMLQAGRVDAAIEVYVDAMQLIRTERALAGLKAAPQCLVSEPLYCYLHRRHRALAAALDDALAAMQREGLIARLNDEMLRAAEVPTLPCGTAVAASAPR